MPKKKNTKVSFPKKQRFEALLEEIQSEVHLISEQSVSHTEKFTSVGKRFDRIEEILEKQEITLGRIEMILEKQIKNEQRFIALENRLAQLEHRV